MTTFREYTDPRLVALYDELNAFAADTAFYIGLAEELCASLIIDIGCGTGLLACELAKRGHEVVGLDPSSVMLDVARHRPSGDLVRWVQGDASRLDQAEFDLAVMTGHVAQVIVHDCSWHKTLAAVYRALRRGGHVAFESRNPGARPWDVWTPQESRRLIDDAKLGRVEVWQQLIKVESGRVSFDLHYFFESSGEELVSTGELRFRSQAELTRSLADTGFSIEHVFGDWDRQPIKVRSRELIFIAMRE